jgi:hypothetical protein
MGMRPTLTAIVVALVLLTAAFLLVLPAQDRAPSSSPALASTGLRADVAPTYGITLALSATRTLPGYHDTLSYEVLNDTNAAPQSGLSTITITGTYYNTNLKLLPLPGTPTNITPPAAVGTWSFQVPVNSSSAALEWPVITVWANSTSLSMNQYQTITVEVGQLQFVTAETDACNAVGSCGNPGDLTTGNPATIHAVAEINADFATAPAVGETAKFIFYSTGSSPVTVAGVPASVTTDGSGEASVTFTPLSTTFNVPGPNHVEIEVTDSVNASLTIYTNVSFYLYNPVGAANFAFWLNQQLYYSGEQGTAYWQWAGTNTTVGTINVTNFQVFDEATGDLIDSGMVASTSPSGSFVFTLPGTYVGSFAVWLYAHNTSDSWAIEEGATADRDIFAALPSEIYYNPGDVITVTITSEGPGISGTTVSAFVQAENSGQTLYNTTVSGTSFQFTIPKVAPATEYVIAAWASSPTAGTVATSKVTIDEASGYDFWAGISTQSSYSDGSFAPGQTVQLAYALTAYGTSQLPKLMELELIPGPCSIVCGADSPVLKIWVTSSASGSVPFTIPSGTPNGLQTFTVLADFPGGNGANQVTVNVNSAPSALNYELGAGSGLTVGWLILLILLIVVAIVILAMARRGKPSRMVMTPTTSSSTPEWKEPPTSGGSAGGSTGGSSAGASTEPPATPPSSE